MSDEDSGFCVKTPAWIIVDRFRLTRPYIIEATNRSGCSKATIPGHISRQVYEDLITAVSRAAASSSPPRSSLLLSLLFPTCSFALPLLPQPTGVSLFKFLSHSACANQTRQNLPGHTQHNALFQGPSRRSFFAFTDYISLERQRSKFPPLALWRCHKLFLCQRQQQQRILSQGVIAGYIGCPSLCARANKLDSAVEG